MKHYYLLFLCLCCSLFSPNIGFTQNLSSPCGADYWRAKNLQDPDFSQKNQAYEQEILSVFEQKKTGTGTPEQTKTIPVVLHIIHDGGPENISDAQAQQAITWLNQALANQGSFDQGSGANCGIQLCLAQRTPDNQPTNGITRDQSALTEMLMETQDLAVKNLNRWKTSDYVNIWLVRNICSTTYGCGVYGYANYPYAHGSNIDGIVIEAAYLTQLNKITGLAHEIGHYLGLYHTFEGGCTNNNCLLDGDRICDTPPDQSTAGVPCEDLLSTCSTDTQSGPYSTDQPDMSWNFLDYGIIACFHDYTPDQSTRMNATLDGIRKSLLTSKGCLPPCPGNTVADFSPSAISITVGQTVNFTNTSQNANSYNWTLNGISFSTQANASYNFTVPGTYTVVLTAQPNNPSLCDASTKQLSILVVCDISASFSLSSLSAEINTPIVITNTSQNTSQLEWFVNGVSQGSTLDTLLFNQAGTYEITLIASNTACESSTSTELYITEICTEDRKTFQLQYQETAERILIGKGVVILEDGNLLFLIRATPTTDQGKIYMVKMTPTGQQLWVKSMNDSALGFDTSNGLVATSDGGYALTFRNGASIGKATLAKFSSDGDLLWSTQYQGWGYLVDLATTPDGKITAFGYSYQNEMRHVFVQYDASGVLQWLKEYKIWAGYFAKSMAPMPDGGFIGVGENGIIIRISNNGNLLWKKRTGNVWFEDVVVTETGEIVACGKSGNQSNGVLVKYSVDGDLLSFMQYEEGSNPTYFKTLIKDGQNGYLLSNRNALDEGSGMLVRLDSAGNFNWARQYPTVPFGGINKLLKFKDIGYIMAGEISSQNPSTSSGWLMKTDLNGRLGECPSKPAFLQKSDVINVTNNNALITEIYTDQFLPTTFAVLNWPIHPDTLCAITCASPVEICNNNIDDDGDGLFDCLDPDCACTEDKCKPKQGNIWYFGDKAGLDFNTDPPTPLTNGKTHDTVVSTVSDINGNMLFYTDGFEVYNRFNQPMPNGFDKGNYVIPNPGDKSLFYLLGHAQTGNGTFYRVVDLKLDNGKGDVAPTNPIPIIQPDWGDVYPPDLTKSCDPDGYWLTTRNLYSNTFRSIHIGVNGIDPVPVISSVGADSSTWGYLKFSPDGKHLAVGRALPETGVEVFDFDASTGIVSNPHFYSAQLNGVNLAEGLEFSPSGRFLYLSTVGYIDPQTGQWRAPLFQFDLKNPDVFPYIVKDFGHRIAQLKLAPNGKIYGSLGGVMAYLNLDIIHKPDAKGAACQYQADGIPIPTTLGAYYFPITPLPDYHVPNVLFTNDAPDTLCNFENIHIHYKVALPTCGVDSIAWSLEGIAGQILAANDTAEVQFFEPGSGQLIVTAFAPCGTSSDTLPVFVVPPLNKTLDLGPDLLVCQNGVFRFNAGSGFAKYQWSDGTADSSTTTLFPGKYWVNVWDVCGNRQTDTINVSIAPGSVLDLGPDLPQQCSDFSASYQRPAIFESWQWSPNEFLSCIDCPNVTLSPTTSTTWIVVARTADGCISIDTLNATIRDTLFFSRDTSVCTGEMLSIFGVLLPADTSAQFFSPAAGPGCDTLLTIHVFGVENTSSELSTTICPNDFYDYNGILLPADTTAIFHFPNSNYCDSLVTVTVNSFPSLHLTMPMDTTIQIGASILLETSANSTGTLDFIWSPLDGLSCSSCPDPIANPLDTIRYTLAVTDANGCTTEGSVTVRVNEVCRIRVPNVFTPNGDGSNDLFRPILDPCVRNVRLWRILNRWGETVFTQTDLAASDPTLGWDGNASGKPQPSDVLIWMAEFEYFDGRRETKHGEVSLLR